MSGPFVLRVDKACYVSYSRPVIQKGGEIDNSTRLKVLDFLLFFEFFV